jgi:hypothetical protein
VRFLALAVLAVLAALACDGDGPDADLGDACSSGHDCEALGADRVCYEKRCVTAADYERRTQEASRVQSGLPPAQPELAEPTLVGGFNVRVQRAEGEGRVFAACRADEFLVGGGCSVVDATHGPVEERAGTTRGGHWLCEYKGHDLQHAAGIKLSAFALCAKP